MGAAVVQRNQNGCLGGADFATWELSCAGNADRGPIFP